MFLASDNVCGNGRGNCQIGNARGADLATSRRHDDGTDWNLANLDRHQ